jgi:gamma-glutamyltranspeptidase/glutathione hydrolase
VSGWDEALKVSREMTGKALPLARLLADAIDYAQNGTPVTASQAHATASKFDELKAIPASRKPGWWTASRRRSSRFYQPAMATTLTRLAEDGLDSFYRGPLANVLAHGMETLGLPVTLADLTPARPAHHAAEAAASAGRDL